MISRNVINDVVHRLFCRLNRSFFSQRVTKPDNEANHPSPDRLNFAVPRCRRESLNLTPATVAAVLIGQVSESFLFLKYRHE